MRIAIPASDGSPAVSLCLLKWMYDPPTYERRITKAIIKTAGGQEHYGETQCSKLDQFDKVKGRKVALARCLKGMHLTVEQRKSVWEQVLNSGMRY